MSGLPSCLCVISSCESFTLTHLVIRFIFIIIIIIIIILFFAFSTSNIRGWYLLYGGLINMSFEG